MRPSFNARMFLLRTRALSTRLWTQYHNQIYIKPLAAPQMPSQSRFPSARQAPPLRSTHPSARARAARKSAVRRNIPSARYASLCAGARRPQTGRATRIRLGIAHSLCAGHAPPENPPRSNIPSAQRIPSGRVHAARKPAARRNIPSAQYASLCAAHAPPENFPCGAHLLCAASIPPRGYTPPANPPRATIRALRKRAQERCAVKKPEAAGKAVTSG